MEILGPGVPDMSGGGVAVNDEQVRALVPAGKRGTVEDVASAACYLASDEAGYVTGHTMVAATATAKSSTRNRVMPSPAGRDRPPPV